MYQERTYRKLIKESRLSPFKVTVKETDLFIHAKKDLTESARKSVLKHRGYIESHISRHPEFEGALAPWNNAGPLPAIIGDMVEAGKRAGIGPMSAVAGAVAEHVGRELLTETDEIIVENGGDLFIRVNEPMVMGVFAGASPLSMKIGLRFHIPSTPFSVCTSSGTIGHSLSLGKADALCIFADSAPLADAAATAVCNRVTAPDKIQSAIDFGKEIEGVRGILAVMGDQVGIWGEMEVTAL